MGMDRRERNKLANNPAVPPKLRDWIKAVNDKNTVFPTTTSTTTTTTTVAPTTTTTTVAPTTTSTTTTAGA